MNFVGIDPSQRHTGLCARREGTGPSMLFYEIKTEGDLLSSTKKIRRELMLWLDQFQAKGTIIGLEKQLSVGGHSSSLLLHVQMTVLEVIGTWASGQEPQLVMPLPVQLRSYLKSKGIPYQTARDTVAYFKTKEASVLTHVRARPSQHIVDAYYLSKMAEEVQAGSWSYPLPSKEAPLHPWRILNGRTDGG